MTPQFPSPPTRHRAFYEHFQKRFTERVGPGDPLEHWWRIIVSVEKEQHHVIAFMGRLNRTGRRLWRYHLPDGRIFLVVFDHKADAPVTILTNDRAQRCGSKGQRVVIDGVPYDF